MAIADLITCSYLFANSATRSAKCTGGYLNSRSFSDNDVAFLLDFEDLSSFEPVFRSWNGMVPNEFRCRPDG